jgi:hypothetical protein
VKPGRELDQLIAEKVMGMKVYRRMGEDGPNPQYEKIEKVPEHCAVTYPPYSTDISAAWEVVEKLRNKTMAFSLVTMWDHSKDKLFWLAKFEWWGTERFEFSSQETAPLAICLAALKATGDFSEK